MPATLRARALLLGERLDHRGLPREGAPTTDPVPLATPEGFTAFAFRWGAVVLIGANAEQEASVIEMLKPRLTNALAKPIEEIATIATGAEQDGVDPDSIIRLRDLAPARLAVVADALAKSAALAHQETLLTDALDRLEPIVTTLRPDVGTHQAQRIEQAGAARIHADALDEQVRAGHQAGRDQKEGGRGKIARYRDVGGGEAMAA